MQPDEMFQSYEISVFSFLFDTDSYITLHNFFVSVHSCITSEGRYMITKFVGGMYYMSEQEKQVVGQSHNCVALFISSVYQKSTNGKG